LYSVCSSRSDEITDTSIRVVTAITDYHGITTKFDSATSAHGEVYLIQHYVIKFVSFLR
jgi:hypothetical protein